MKALRTYIAELLGTFWLVLCGCGSVLIAADFHTATGGSIGIGVLGVAFAFGLSLMTMVYVIGPVSGCHINPAVTIGLTVAGRFESKHVVPYIIAQVIGPTAAATAAIPDTLRKSRRLDCESLFRGVPGALMENS